MTAESATSEPRSNDGAAVDSAGPRAPRQDNRRGALMDAAARLFAEQGYRATTIRDIAGAAGMLPGSVYYHFKSKEALLLAVYREGVARIIARVDAASAGEQDPWAKLEAASAGHLQTILDANAYAQVIVRVVPADAAGIAGALTRARDQYEDRFRELVEALALAPKVDRDRLRLMLLGALNWAKIWYRPGGAEPAAIARDFVALLRRGAAGDGPDREPKR
ncbi:MAG: TetR/AcrR family transcriptional regulator [Alphaproteobacteria bacterium]